MSRYRAAGASGPHLTEQHPGGGFEAHAWQGLVVPARTPDAVAGRLTSELATALRDPAVTDKMRGIGLGPRRAVPALEEEHRHAARAFRSIRRRVPGDRDAPAEHCAGRRASASRGGG